MQAIYMIRRWTEKLCRKGQDAELFECELADPAIVDVIFETEDDGEGGAAIRIDQVLPQRAIVLDGGTGPALLLKSGVDCLEYLPPSLVQEMRETIEIPNEVEPEWELFA